MVEVAGKASEVSQVSEIKIADEFDKIKPTTDLSAAGAKLFWGAFFSNEVKGAETQNKSDASDKETQTEFNNLDDMKEVLEKTYKEIKADKPHNSPNIAKWFENSGTIKVEQVDGKTIWTYTDAEKKSVQYIDGEVKFPPEAKHPVIGDLSIGEFTGDRTKDKELYLKKLEEEYSLTEIPDGYTLHHDTENGVMQLVKEDYHKEFTHAGGHSMYKEGN